MASPNAQLRKIYEDLQARFADSSYIEIIPLDDDPPEKYEIKFNVVGLIQDDKGKVSESREHAIFINIPFGYPHFPPSCTPKSPTFHPDFDQAAICIGEYWNKDKTLSDLIVHIAKMITGEVYSTENVFNDAALAWYKKIANQLPFEKIDLDYSSGSTIEDDFYELEEEDLIPQGLDTLDEDDFSSPSDFLGDEPAAIEEEISFQSAPKTTGKSSINRIHLLIRQHRYYELSTFLKDLPTDEQFEDREEIEEKVFSRIERATQLQREGDEAEHQGDPKTALGRFQQVAELVPDYPNIEESIDRAQNSIELESDDWSTDDAEAAPVETEAEVSEEAASKPRVTFFEETTKKTVRLLPILAGVIVIVLAGIFITPFFGAQSKLEDAQSRYQQCKSFAERGLFEQARGECDAALSLLKDISLFKRSQKNALERQIKNLLTSEDMVQGLAGRVLYKGKYIKKVNMERVQEFTEQKQAGDELFEKGQWKKAAEKYAEALKTAAPISDSFEESLLSRLEENIVVANIHLTMERGESLLGRGELEKSHDQFSEARTHAENLPEEAGGVLLSRIESKIQEIEYLQHLDLGKKYFDANDWEAAIKQYEQALKLQEKATTAAGDSTADSLYSNMAEAELFSIINSAKNAFSKSEWQNAINRYIEAIQLLDDKKELLRRVDPDEIKQQLQRIILRARIVQFKQKADSALAKGAYSEAIAALEQVIEAVISSGFQNDEEFNAIIAGTRKTIRETSGKAAIASRIAYLKRNYKDIFEANYSAAVPEKLSDPKVSFVRYQDGKELYEIQCLENNLGRKLRLVMYYSYNPATNNWQFYSENN